MISVQVQIYADELLLRLDLLPKELHDLVRKKYDSIFADLQSRMLNSVPAKYIDPTMVQTGTQEVGNSLIGYIEGEDKPGVYAIYPTKARVLRFVTKSGELVFTPRVLAHPYPKAAPAIQRFLVEQKPWVVDQMNAALKG